MRDVPRKLTASAHRLIDATIRTDVDAATITSAKDDIDSATAQLSDALMPQGPPGMVHGATAHLPGKPPYTGTLTLRYVRGTPLGKPLHAQAHDDRRDRTKTFAVGHIADADGVTVQAEGVFIHPKRAKP